MTSNDNQLVADISSLRVDDASAFGGKNANLGELASIGLPIPSGFAVSTSAFSSFIASIVAPMSLRQLTFHHIRKISPKLHRTILRTALPPNLTASIQGEYRKLMTASGKRTLAFAVRSSAIAEDSGENSFAGIYDTFLGVKGFNNLLKSIKKCYASMFTREALSYREAIELTDTAQMLMGVGVLRMIQARSGGVMFTVNPTGNQDDELSISSIWGLGSAVVDGRFATDSFEASRHDFRPLTSSVARKIRIQGSDGRIVRVPPNLVKKPSLTTPEIVSLAQSGVKAERHFGHPLDIEWCVEKGTNKVYFLQCRPLGVS